MEPATWVQIIANLGFPIALVVYLLKRDKSRDEENLQREQRLGERIDQLEEKRANEVMELTKQCSATIATNSSDQRRLARSIENLIRILEARPCLIPGKPTDYQPTAQPSLLPQDEAPASSHTSAKHQARTP